MTRLTPATETDAYAPVNPRSLPMKDKSIDGPGLSPCPFCGCEIGVSGIWLLHPENGCILSGYEFGDATKDEGDKPEWAIAAWETRSNNAPALVESLQGLLSVWGHKPGTTSRARHEAFLAAKDVLSTALGEMNDA